MTEVKIGAYICKGCGIGERLNTQQLVSIAQRENHAKIAKEHDFLCSTAGIKIIKDDIAAGAVTHVVIGACSRRSKSDAFSLAQVAMSRANLREGVIWIRPADAASQETTQEMANDYFRMACAEVNFMQLPTGNHKTQTEKKILVVGGGVSGMTSAIEAAKAGYDVTLVEKSPQLGGWTSEWYKRVPQRTPYLVPEDTGIDALIQQVTTASKINVLLNSTLTATHGAPGQFIVDIATESGSTKQEKFGAIVQASGFSRYDLKKLPEFSGGVNPDVIDQIGLERLAKAADGKPITRPSDGKEIKSVVFVQCAGQRSQQAGHLSYCSGFCCSASIKQAMYFKQIQPNIDTTIIYTDLRTPGAPGENFYRSGQDKGIIFTKGLVASVQGQGAHVNVKFKDLILNMDLQLDVDLVVLATGMVANAGVDIDQLAKEEAEQTNRKKVPKSISVLNLSYRQGPDIPQLTSGFADSHFICFPYETRRTGIYSTGPTRRPMDIYQATEDAAGATLKAIQAIENAGIGRSAHFRAGDLSFPSFRMEDCTQCRRCTVECPFGAIDEDEKHYPVFNESRCRRCGICMGACPVHVISFENYSVDTVGQQIKVLDIPGELAEKPRILVLACENDAYPALDMAAQSGIQYSPFVRIVPVRCLGSVNTIWITEALNHGYDGVILMGCQKGDNYQCHFIKGSEIGHIRMSKIDDTLQQLQLESDRVKTYEVAITDIHRAPRLINDMEAWIKSNGMSPFKF